MRHKPPESLRSSIPFIPHSPELAQPYGFPVARIIERLHTAVSRGLEAQEVQRRIESLGENQLQQHRPRRLIHIFLEQFRDPVIYVLGVATVLAFVFGERIEGIAVLVVIMLTVLIGFFMEWQAVRSMEALQKIAQIRSWVLRDGKEIEIKARYVVPGDILLLYAGDAVTADARIITHERLTVNESALTGESVPVEKSTETLEGIVPLSGRKNMVFKGTMITRGSAKAVVTATGDHTELGKVNYLSQATHKEKPPLEKKLHVLTEWLIKRTLAVAGLIIVVGIFQGRELLPLIETSIALAVAAIPEGLPIVVTIALARGMLRLTKRQVVIKKMDAVQTLGELGIICTDKTGTLTENQMAVHSVVLGDQRIEAAFDKPGGFFADALSKGSFQRLVEVGVLCNNAFGNTPEKQGDPIESALLAFASRAGMDVDGIRQRFPEILESPFDPSSKMMATLNQTPDGYRIHVKGALESLLPRCTAIYMGDGSQVFEEKAAWLEQADALAAQGLRVLAYAYRNVADSTNPEVVLEGLTFLGLIGFLDPPRKDVRAAVETYRRAGIRVIMVTGDHPNTARKIAEEIGLLERDAPAHAVLQGTEIPGPGALSAELEARVLEATIFARVSPEQKLDLIAFYQHRNHIVGMTGDGVNDAPALKKADIGIAMGIRGTEAAQEVADVILEDDQFTSIELAIQQGRAIFEKIRQFVVYLLSSNLAEIISVTLATLANVPMPLLPLQILFLNLITDVFPALALGMGEGEKDLMDMPPRAPEEPIMTRALWRETVFLGFSITAAVLGITLFGWFGLKLPAAEVNNMAFYTLVLAQLLNVFNLPRRGISFFRNEITSNPWIWGALGLSAVLTAGGYFLPITRDVLSLVPLRSGQFGWVLLFGFGALGLAQGLKRL